MNTRFGLIHLLMWGVASALYLGIQRTLLPREFVTNLAGLQLVSMVSEGVSSGAAIGGVFITAYRRFRRLPFPAFPGEWLWFAIGSRLLLSMGASATLLVLNLSYLSWRFTFPAGALLFLVGAVVTRKNAVWSVLFSVAFAIQTIQSCLAWVAPTLFLNYSGNPTRDFVQFFVLWLTEPVLPALILFVPLWMDIQKRHGLPWTHWGGMAAYLCGCFVSVFSFVVFMH